MPPEYLDKNFDWRLPEIAEYHDELPLWSAPFGLELLERIPLKPDMTVLDIGFGTGFPLIEIAQRLGSSCTVYGIDQWNAAIDRVKRKLNAYKVNNIRIIEGDAASLPFENEFFDMVTANLVINNLEEPDKVFQEIHRTMKPGGCFYATSNLPGHMKEFYDIFIKTLTELKMEDCFPALYKNIEHRLSAEIISSKLKSAGLRVSQLQEDRFFMRFLNGSALLNHSFIIMGFMDGWKAAIPDADKIRFFSKLEENLNQYAKEKGELKLTIPYVYIEAGKAA